MSITNYDGDYLDDVTVDSNDGTSVHLHGGDVSTLGGDDVPATTGGLHPQFDAGLEKL